MGEINNGARTTHAPPPCLTVAHCGMAQGLSVSGLVEKPTYHARSEV